MSGRRAPWDARTRPTPRSRSADVVQRAHPTSFVRQTELEAEQPPFIIERGPCEAAAPKHVPALTHGLMRAWTAIEPVADRGKRALLHTQQPRQNRGEGAFPKGMIERATGQFHPANGHRETLAAPDGLRDRGNIV